SLAALAYWYFKPKPQKPNYITANVERSDIENSVMSTGKIEGIKQVDVGAQVSGEVTKLYVEVGDTVKKGDVIAQIDPVTLQNTLTTQQATLQQSKANLESTKSAYQTKQAALATARADLKGKIATLQQSQTEYNRLKSLLAMNAISKQELEQADTAVKTAQANVDSAKEAIATAQANIASSQADIVSAQQTIKKSQTDVNTAEKNLGYSQIVAPMSGTVISITTKQGQTVNANQSAPTIVTLADLSSVRVKAKISEADVVNLKVGLPVYFNIIGRPDKKYQATLSTIGPAPDGTTASDSSTSTDSAIYYIGYFTVPNPDGALRINMTAQVYIVENKVSNVLSVPAAAIKTDPKIGSYVEVVQADGNTKKQAVKTGVTNRITTQILSGVNQGDKVVVGQATVSKSSSSSKNKGGPPML
ncbi:MAG: efflux RND transporter periplasmic adaptor subunit, partial [Moraxella osloensis]|nr:efflux RND transporter periplasmic adaptor subunit [Moraxella osloensis]